MLSTARLRDRVTLAILAIDQKVMDDKEAGRVGEAETWDLYSKAIGEYLKLMENTVRAARATIAAMDSTRTRAEKATNGNERNVLV